MVWSELRQLKSRGYLSRFFRSNCRDQRATRRAKQLVANQTVQCRLEGRRSYDREVGVCALEEGRDFGQVLISKGDCSRWRG